MSTELFQREFFILSILKVLILHFYAGRARDRSENYFLGRGVKIARTHGLFKMLLNILIQAVMYHFIHALFNENFITISPKNICDNLSKDL